MVKKGADHEKEQVQDGDTRWVSQCSADAIVQQFYFLEQ